jgi:transcriptional regulator with XRE-family HTH domain
MYEFKVSLLQDRYKKRGYTFQQLSDITGVSKMTLHELIAKGKNPSIKTLCAVCDALDVSPRSLFRGVK